MKDPNGFKSEKNGDRACTFAKCSPQGSLPIHLHADGNSEQLETGISSAVLKKEKKLSISSGDEQVENIFRGTHNPITAIRYQRNHNERQRREEVDHSFWKTPFQSSNQNLSKHIYRYLHLRLAN
ncbi:unnamed protein product [Orchesella dallaii]|uniref:Uncharacterized protein n=1 Tax=Orchesella dallaii TaxID=48710 RepID=A0ABP1QJE7_9HEXA